MVALGKVYNEDCLFTMSKLNDNSIDSTGLSNDITEEMIIPSDTTLYCLHDKENRLLNLVKKYLEDKGYNLNFYFEIMKIYSN